MNKDKIEIITIGVLGAGTMGTGIASVCALKGLKTIVYDVSREIIEKTEKIFYYFVKLSY